MKNEDLTQHMENSIKFNYSVHNSTPFIWGWGLLPFFVCYPFLTMIINHLSFLTLATIFLIMCDPTSSVSYSSLRARIHMPTIFERLELFIVYNILEWLENYLSFEDVIWYDRNWMHLLKVGKRWFIWSNVAH